uniref:EamA domain-containing protein n=1 Tax=Minutocellus polymorphus TaxID=265543 RepID=A0A7S0ALD7_9STRA
MSAIKRRAVISGLLGASASAIGKIALDPASPVQSSARGLCNRFVPADIIIPALNTTMLVPSGQLCKAIELGIRGMCLLLMIATNAAMMATFLDGMNESGTVAGTALANAANFSLSAIYGIILFEESITTLWMVGFVMILAGAWVLSSVQLKDKGNTNKGKKDR